MKKYISTGILVSILVLPVFIILSLYKFGENHYGLKIFYENGLYGDQPGKPHTIPDFRLKDQEGKFFSKNDVNGRVYIADFIFTSCQSICPKMTSQLKRVQREFLNISDVIIVSHTVDPEHDDVKVLSDYANSNGAKYGKWFFLTGSKQEIYQLALKGYIVSALQNEHDSTDFIHTEKLVLVDKMGRIRGYYDGTDPAKVDTLILETKILLKEEN